MKKILPVFILLISLGMFAQDENFNREIFRFGMYMRGSSKTFSRISPSAISNSKTNLSIPVIEKQYVSLFIEMPFSPVFTKSNTPEFFFYFIDGQNKNPLTHADFGIMIKNYPFVYGNNPNQFVLIRLFKDRKKRAMRLEKENTFFGAKFEPLSIDTIPYVSIPISDSSFKVIPNKLPPGEYGFIYKEPVPYGRVIYDFSIEE